MPITAQTAGSVIPYIAHIAGKNRQRPKRVEYGCVHIAFEPSPKSDPPPRSVPCPVHSDSHAADVAPEPRKATDAAVVHSDGSEDDSDTPRQPPSKKTKKEKTEERGRKEAASVGFKTEAPRGGSHRISAAPTRAGKYKDSPKGNAHLMSLRRMLKKKAGTSLGRLAHHYKQCIDAINSVYKPWDRG